MHTLAWRDCINGSMWLQRCWAVFFSFLKDVSPYQWSNFQKRAFFYPPNKQIGCSAKSRLKVISELTKRVERKFLQNWLSFETSSTNFCLDCLPGCKKGPLHARIVHVDMWKNSAILAATSTPGLATPSALPRLSKLTKWATLSETFDQNFAGRTLGSRHS